MKLSQSKTSIQIAVNVATSWLRCAGQDVVVAQNHKSLFCRDKQVLFYEGAPEPEAFNARAMASSDFETAAQCFAEISSWLGLGELRPVPRPIPTPDQDALLRALRPNEYRFAPDLGEKRLAVYAPVIASVVGAFSYSNRYRLEATGVRKEDLLLASRMWAASFDLRYRREHDPEASQKIFGNYLKQRLVHFVQMVLEPQPHLVMTESGVELSAEEAEGPSTDAISADLALRAVLEPPAVFEAKIAEFMKRNPNTPQSTAKRLSKRIAWLRQKEDPSGEDFLYALSARLGELDKQV